MAQPGVRERVVEVIADYGPQAKQRYGKQRYGYGSGCIVYGRTVLTSAHVVADAERVWVRDADKKKHPATLDPRFVGDAGVGGGRMGRRGRTWPC